MNGFPWWEQIMLPALLTFGIVGGLVILPVGLTIWWCIRKIEQEDQQS